MNRNSHFEHTLNNRQQRILRFVVDQFVRNGNPVGSRTLSKLKDEHLSPASIRNTMADLEDMGLLYQPHTSAGRVPTDLGYRYFIDQLMPPSSFSLSQLHELEQEIVSYHGMIGSVLENISQLLSRYSNYIGIVTTPRFDSMVFKRIEFIRRGSGRIQVVFITSNGSVLNKMVEVDGDYNQEQLDKISRWIVDHFEGQTLSKMRESVLDMLRKEQNKYDLLAKQALVLSKKSFAKTSLEQTIFVGGTTNLLKDPEFVSSQSLEELLKAIEQKHVLLELIGETMNSDGVEVVIGSETQLQQINGCSLVAGAYNFPDGSRGTLAVLGPKRMHYPRTIYLVDYVSKQISRIES